MPKMHGKYTRIYVNGVDISNFFTSAEVSAQTDTAEVTAFGDADKRYVIGLNSGSARLAGYFDASPTGNKEALLRSLLGADANPHVAIVTREAPGAVAECSAEIETSLSVSSPIGGAVAMNADMTASGGFDSARTFVPIQSLSGASATYDNGAAAPGGGRVHLHVFAVSGSPTINVRHSPDGSTWATLTSVGTPAAGSAYRIDITTSIDRYLSAEVTGGSATIFAAIYTK